MRTLSQILSIDQGTTNSKAVLVSSDGSVSRVGSAPVGLSLPQPGWVEQDAEDIWDSVLQAIEHCLASPDQKSDQDLAALTISNQRESVLAWRRSDGQPLGPVIGWQDHRTADWCRTITTPESEHLVHETTGLRIDAMFSAPKLHWLLEQITATGTAHNDVCVGTIDSWLIWRLTGGAAHLCEAGNASRTLLYDVRTLDWDERLLELFGVPLSVLPDVRASNAGFGKTSGVPGLPDGLPIAAVLADSHAALYGQGCTTVGTGKATYGTGSSVMSPVATAGSGGSRVPSTLAWVTDQPTYAVEGNILSTGAALAWMATTLGLPDAAALAILAGEVPDSGGITFVPAFSGLGAPHWDRTAVAQISGMTQATGRAHLARAALEAVAHQICDVVDEMERAGGRHLDLLRADGGGTASALLMQIQADVLGRPVLASNAPEVSAIGVALLGWHSLGHPGAALVAEGGIFEPQLSPARRATQRTAWKEAINQAVAGSRETANSR